MIALVIDFLFFSMAVCCLATARGGEKPPDVSSGLMQDIFSKNKMVSPWIAFVLLYIQEIVLAFDDDEVCYSKRKGYSSGCQFGCCGNTNDKECCDPMGMMVGISIGGVVVLASIVAIIVCCIKQHTRNKRRLQPRQHQPVMMVTEAKGPPAYPGLPYGGCNTVYNDGYKGPIVQPPSTYQLPPGYPPPSYSSPDPQTLYGVQPDKEPNSPPPPYPAN